MSLLSLTGAPVELMRHFAQVLNEAADFMAALQAADEAEKVAEHEAPVDA